MALLAAAFVTNLVFGQFHPGFANQPVAHTQGLWNFSGMVVAGLAFALAGGCPGRQLFMAGEGDGDAAIFVIGMVAGAALSHNFGLASSPKGWVPTASPRCSSACSSVWSSALPCGKKSAHKETENAKLDRCQGIILSPTGPGDRGNSRQR